MPSLTDEGGPRIASESGFSLVELLVATTLVLIVVGGMLGLVNPARQIAEAQPEQIDMQQRARFGMSLLYRDLLGAGAGLDAGPSTGALVGYLPPVLPRRIGALSPDPPETARADVLTVIRVPELAAQAALLAPMADGLMMLKDGAGCPIGQPACGFAAGMGALVFDPAGHFDLFTVLAVAGPAATLRHRGPSGTYPYREAAFAAQVDVRTYYVNAVTRQLRRYDSDTTDVPVMDDVIEMRAEYFGLSNPPRLPKPPLGEANCLYDAAGMPMSGLTTLAGGSGPHVSLPIGMFADGPWCSAGESRFDADLLRIRQVRISLRVQASSTSFRTAGTGFAVAGSSRSAWRALPDVEVTFDVVPRNLSLND